MNQSYDSHLFLNINNKSKMDESYATRHFLSLNDKSSISRTSLNIFVSNSINYPFFKLNKIINKNHKNTSEFTRIINNKILISVGTDNKIFIYDKYLQKIYNINFRYWVNNIEHRASDNDNDNLKIIVCTKNEIYIIYFSNNNLFNSHLSLKKGDFNFLLKINNNQFLICEEKFVSMEKEGFKF